MVKKTLFDYGARAFAGLSAAVLAGVLMSSYSPQSQSTRAENAKAQSINYLPSRKQIPLRPVENSSLEKAFYKTKDFSTDSEEVALARMLFGEARNCTTEEMFAIAYSAINRNKDGKSWNGEEDLKTVLHAPWQYSCFNKNDPNLEKLKDPQKYDAKSWKRALRVSREAIQGKRFDLNKGQTHYFNARVVNPTWSSTLDSISFEEQQFRHTFKREP